MKTVFDTQSNSLESSYEILNLSKLEGYCLFVLFLYVLPLTIIILKQTGLSIQCALWLGYTNFDKQNTSNLIKYCKIIDYINFLPQTFLKLKLIIYLFLLIRSVTPLFFCSLFTFRINSQNVKIMFYTPKFSYLFTLICLALI